ncbi:hypothetical protein [Parvularcula dongshanensis]|uniref:CBM-cenC domain-containing protein n=1 Tax=Parvularcula dongshanensis TaxID=1173995 RepID=A0A840I578_9PROT|nr:hypothetical protein [Parvularcula dongshanensis]MBB4659937.1 hypothetical protein [Parvularcula dongshanensis]
MRGRLIILLAGLALASPAAAQTEDEALAALEEALPGTLVNNPLEVNWNVYGEGASGRVAKADVAGGTAFRVKVKRPAADAWRISAAAPVQGGVEAGDVVLIAVWARAEKMDPDQDRAEADMRLQETSEPWTALASRLVPLSEDWQLHYLNGTAQKAYAPGEIGMSFNVGGLRQTVEIGQYYVMNMGQNADPAGLPSGSVTP